MKTVLELEPNELREFKRLNCEDLREALSAMIIIGEKMSSKGSTKNTRAEMAATIIAARAALSRPGSGK